MTEIEENRLIYLKQISKTELKQFLQEELELDVTYGDICSGGPKWYCYKPRWFNLWGQLSYEDLTKIKEFLKAKTLIVYTHPQEERGWEPLTILIVYEDDNLEELKDYFPK